MPTGPRIRDNNVLGTISDNPLTAGAASFNSVLLPLLSAVVSAHAIVTLDPLRQYGNPEIVIVTSHTAASTVATITRGAYNTTARSHPQGTVWIHNPTNEDVIPIVTSSTRPADPYRGETIFETDTNRYVSRSTADAWQQLGLFFDPPACRIFHNASQNIANNDATQYVLFNSERYDTDSMHDSVTNTSRITINTAGIYSLAGKAFYPNNAIGIRELIIVLNRTTNIDYDTEPTPSAGQGAMLRVMTQYKFIAGDFIELRTFQNSGGVLALAQFPNWAPEFSATWIGRGN